MTVSSVATGYDGISLLAGNAAYDPAGTFLIQRVAGTGSSGTITFSSIPQNYKHLQIRVIARCSESAAQTNYDLQLNGDTGSNYAYHYLAAIGTAVIASGAATQSSIFLCAMPAGNAPANAVGPKIIDIHDYTSTTKYKTVRKLEGQINSTYGGQMHISSGLWMNTAAITSITLSVPSFNFTTQSSFALYGMVG